MMMLITMPAEHSSIYDQYNWYATTEGEGPTARIRQNLPIVMERKTMCELCNNGSNAGHNRYSRNDQYVAI